MANDREPRINQSTTTSGVTNGARNSSRRPDDSRKPSEDTTRQSGSGTVNTDGGAPSRQNTEAGSKSGQL